MGSESAIRNGGKAVETGACGKWFLVTSRLESRLMCATSGVGLEPSGQPTRSAGKLRRSGVPRPGAHKGVEAFTKGALCDALSCDGSNSRCDDVVVQRLCARANGCDGDQLDHRHDVDNSCR